MEGGFEMIIAKVRRKESIAQIEKLHGASLKDEILAIEMAISIAIASGDVSCGFEVDCFAFESIVHSHLKRYGYEVWYHQGSSMVGWY
jgi:hypothetical protein